ncbi:MAG TPA: hypothetical protein VF177_18030 [Anaerolineae bacterium]
MNPTDRMDTVYLVNTDGNLAHGWNAWQWGQELAERRAERYDFDRHQTLVQQLGRIDEFSARVCAG